MPEDIFRFKKFSVCQSSGAARIGTDGVLLGTWANCENATRILDIGTGTGIIALMAAQRSSASVFAVEIEKSAHEQAAENFSNSPWKNRLLVENIDFNEFANRNLEPFDYIISNPPFFERAYKAGSPERNLARHTDSLAFDDLLSGVKKCLSPGGIFGLILPYDTAISFIGLAQNYNLHCIRKCAVKPNFAKPAKRLLCEFSFTESKCLSSELTIETDQRHSYTEEYKALARDFYLKF